MAEEAIVSVPGPEAGVRPLRVVDNLQRLLDARGGGWADVATVVAMVIVVAMVAFREDSIGVPGDRFG